MKLVKIFGVVMAVHAAVFMFIFAIPGCRSTGKKPVTTAAIAGGTDTSPVTATDAGAPLAETAAAGAPASVRFSPTRPGTPAAVDATVSAVLPAATAATTYTVVKGDNLWTIAKKNGVTIKQLTTANNMRSDSHLSLGQKLVVPGKSGDLAVVASNASAVTPPSSAKVPPTAVASAAVATTHVVKSGESLGAIAKKYQVKVGDIATANNIADPTKLRVGQTLKIPGVHAAATKPAAVVSKPAAVAPAVTKPAPASAPVAAPIFTSPLIEAAPAASPNATESPLITPAASASDAPVINVEDSAAPKVQ
jgi:LysM repeat protein